MTSKPDSEAELDTELAADADVIAEAEVPEVQILDEASVGSAILASHALALSALAEVTPLSSVGEFVDYVSAGEGAVSLRFANKLAGYPGWLWNVTLSQLHAEDGTALAPTVLELELLPEQGALLAPEWVPWAQRLAEYQLAQQRLLAEAEAAALAVELDDEDDFDEDELSDDEIDIDLVDEESTDELDDEDSDEAELDDDILDLDAADFDTDGSPLLHSGDLDGVEIDEELTEEH